MSRPRSNGDPTRGVRSSRPPLALVAAALTAAALGVGPHVGCMRGGFDGRADASPRQRDLALPAERDSVIVSAEQPARDLHEPCAGVRPCRDPSFGDDGVVQVAVGGARNIGWSSHGLAPLGDGSLLLAGKGETANQYDFMVLRLRADGSLDPSFGQSGVALIDLGQPAEEAKSLTVLPDGRITLAGGTGDQPGLVRLLPDGSPDHSFGTAGVVVADVPSSRGVFNGHTVRADGRVIAGGQAFSSSGNWNFLVAGVAANGALDVGFGIGAFAMPDFGAGDEFGDRPLLRPSGGILIAGSSLQAAPRGHDCAILGLRADGQPDALFGNVGRVTADIGNATNRCPTLLQLPGGRLVTGGYVELAGQEQAAVLRFSAAGALDTTFGDQGAVVLDLGGKSSLRSLVLLPDGRLLATGRWHNGTDYDLAVVALQSEGQLDATFGQGGLYAYDVAPGADDNAQYATLDPQGRLLVLANSATGGANKMVVLRLLL